jgi:hypothetical protein
MASNKHKAKMGRLDILSPERRKLSRQQRRVFAACRRMLRQGRGEVHKGFVALEEFQRNAVP